jgi:murein DD-endopeptidase MepM/ murein hydrolase activator NlpD
VTFSRRHVLVSVGIAAVLLGALLAGTVAAGRPAPAVYLLPWEAGQVNRHTVIQGNLVKDPTGNCLSGCSTHRDQGMENAWDFDLPEGTEVLASRAGTVALASGNWPPDHCGGLTPEPGAPAGYVVSANIGNEANYVLIDHGDGTSALYLHLSALAPAIERKAVTGAPVAVGEVLGLSGRTGLTQCEPHLHFQVEKSVRADWFTNSVPVQFADHDVISQTTDGKPVEGESYVSDNSAVATSP